MIRLILRGLSLSVCGLTILVGSLFGEPGNCPALSDATRAQLTEYVKYKYQMSTGTILSLVSVEPANDACYLKVSFSFSDSSRAREFPLFLSPDHRFLTRELLDTSVDLAAEERLYRQRLKKGLTEGTFPTQGGTHAQADQIDIVVFSDFQCLYCREAAESLRRDVLPQAGRGARLVFRHLPLPMHTWARPAAEAGACAFQQGNEMFWALHDFLFANHDAFTAANVTDVVNARFSAKSFDREAFSRCMSSGEGRSAVDTDVRFAQTFGISGTPAVFIDGELVSSKAADILSVLRQKRK